PACDLMDRYCLPRRRTIYRAVPRRPRAGLSVIRRKSPARGIDSRGLGQPAWRMARHPPDAWSFLGMIRRSGLGISRSWQVLADRTGRRAGVMGRAAVSCRAAGLQRSRAGRAFGAVLPLGVGNSRLLSAGVLL